MTSNILSFKINFKIIATYYIIKLFPFNEYVTFNVIEQGLKSIKECYKKILKAVWITSYIQQETEQYYLLDHSLIFYNTELIFHVFFLFRGNLV